MAEDLAASRFGAPIEFALPNAQAWRKILERELTENRYTMNDDDWRKLCAEVEGFRFSGRDLMLTVKIASQAVSKEQLKAGNTTKPELIRHINADDLIRAAIERRKGLEKYAQ